jgi:hypothetical protein
LKEIKKYYCFFDYKANNNNKKMSSEIVTTEAKIKQLLSNPLVRLGIVIVLIVIIFFIIEYQMKKMSDKVQFINHRVIKGLSRQSLINTLENKIQSVHNDDSEHEEEEEEEEFDENEDDEE